MIGDERRLLIKQENPRSSNGSKVDWTCEWHLLHRNKSLLLLLKSNFKRDTVSLKFLNQTRLMYTTSTLADVLVRCAGSLCLTKSLDECGGLFLAEKFKSHQ